MNIIELFEKLQFDKDKMSSFSDSEIIRIEKKINVEKKLSSDVDVNVASNLLEAIRNYPTEFGFITNHRFFYNFFAKSNYSRDIFFQNNCEVETDRIKLFLTLFLAEELTLFFDKKLVENDFAEINSLLIFRSYLPEFTLSELNQKVINKIDLAENILSFENKNLDIVNFVTDRNFYILLSFLNSLDMDNRVSSLLNYILPIYYSNNNSEFAIATMISMGNYQAIDNDIKATFKKIVR